MGKIILGLGILAMGGYLFAQYQINLKRDQLIFETQNKEVAIKINEMETLMLKMLKTGSHNYFIDNDGYLYLGSEKVAPLEGAINNSKVRNDLAFRQFTDEEFKKFFYLMRYLIDNHFDSSYRNKVIERFVFSYRSIPDMGYNNIRSIMIVHRAQDTLSSIFKHNYQILDRKLNLVLIAPSDAKIR